MTFLLLIRMVLVIIWEVFHGRISLNLGLLLLLVNFIRHHKYHVKPHSSPWWFSAACAPSIAHRTQFFHLYQQNKSSESKLNFRQDSNCCKRVLESAKLAYTTKTRVHDFPETWLSGLLWIGNSFLHKGKSVIPPLFNGPNVLSYASDKAKLFANS